MDLDSPLTELPGIGPVRARAFAEAGVVTAADLLRHLPHRYEDRRRISSIGELAAPGEGTFVGRVEGVRTVRVRRRRLTMVRGTLHDGSGELPVIWFNRPYLAGQLTAGEEYLLSGRAQQRTGRWELVNPTVEKAGRALHAGRVVPIYPALGKLGPASLRRVFEALLERVDLAAVADDLPDALRRRYGLPSLAEALQEVHRPGDEAEVELLNEWRSAAHQRLIYGELLELQLELALLRRHEVRDPKRHRYGFGAEVGRIWRGLLPFELTGAQQRVVEEIVVDLLAPEPMLRLLQGDVGSGKTIVAALALVTAMESGYQGAFMAPTEILAEQHFRTLSRWLGDRYRLVLLTGSKAESRDELEALRRGDTRLAVGTHALIQSGVEFHRLALVVVDEQHRFGVGQRQLLQRKGDRPDLLVMTATPIPRSMALTVYGDLELSVIDELPPGRQPVVTRVVPAARREGVYRWLEKQLAAGAQVYIVFPLIEASEQIAAAAVEAEGEQIRRRLAAFPSAVLHGRVPAPEREETMRRFAAGEVRLLVATSLVEVGLDVPGASTMIIESAERFGLAQLHQLRGRVGRGEARSSCIAIHGRLGAEAKARLDVFATTADGFELAEADLEIRGPGDLLGTRQAGLPVFRAARLARDREWLERAREDARELLGQMGADRRLPLVARVEARAASRYERFAGG